MNEILSYTTAGGVVLNKQGSMLALSRTVIRNGKPSREVRLPKGHIDPGETAEEAAMREVGEESGYWSVEIVADLGLGHSSFCRDGIRYERDERYFLMRLASDTRQATSPTSEEEALFKPQWLNLAEAPARLTFTTEQEFAVRAASCLKNMPDPERKSILGPDD